LKSNGLHGVVSQHTTYELARTFLNPKNTEIGKELFLIIKELEPIFTCETQTLLKREISKLKNESSSGMSYLIESIYVSPLNEAMDEMCKGELTQKYTSFISGMEKAFDRDNEMWDGIIKKRDKQEFKQKSFQQYKTEWLETVSSATMQSQVMEFAGSRLDTKDIDTFMKNINSYPAMRTLIYSNLYLNFVAKQSGNRPSKDKSDDFRHLIDSSYCTTIVSSDERLSGYSKEINPDIEFVTFEEFMTWFR